MKSSGDKDSDKGLIRDALNGQGKSVIETFAQIEKLAQVELTVENIARNLFTSRINLNEDEGKGSWDIVRVRDELYVVICDFMYLDPRYERITGDELIEFHIKLSGHLMLTTGDTGHIKIEGPSLLVWNQPEGSVLEEWMDSKAEEKSVTIYCSRSYIFNLISDMDNFATSKLAKIIEKFRERVSYCNLPINEDIMHCATEIIDARANYKKGLWLTYIEAKSLELLCLIMRCFTQLSEAADVSYSKADLERFHKIRDVLAQQFSPPPTIPGLAKEIGMNPTKLKYGFKSLFGMTIFEYGHACRMQRAMELLRENLHVTVVAEKIGYKHQTTFTAAFKSHFGFRPKNVRKLR